MVTRYFTPPTQNETSGILEIFSYINGTVDGLFFLVMLFVVWIVTFIATKQYSSDRAFTYASFICIVLAIPLAVLNLIGSQWMYLFMILTGVGVVWLKLAGNRSF